MLKPVPSITVVSTTPAPFVADDVAHLSSFARVTWLRGSGLRQILRMPFRLWNTDLVICWFASVYAALAVWLSRRFHLPSVVIVGGVDVAKVDALGYGLWTSAWRGRLAGYALRNASRVLVVDSSLTADVCTRAAYDAKNVRTLPTGYDSSFWRPVGPKQDMVLTVAGVSDLARFRIKGLDLLLQAARELPGMRFTIIGVSAHLLTGRHVPENVTIVDSLRREDLLPYYQRAKIYCQSSLREGLSNALCEAMLCECIPVATDVGGTRNAVGDAGILIAGGDVQALVLGIRHAMGLPQAYGADARGRIVALFSDEKRKAGLISVVSELVE